MTLGSGTRLGPYEIQAAIGAGGMGEVYKARDTRLDRSVAIKVLPAHVSADPERRARFEREAKTIAGLTHPHICTLYDVGEHDGAMFLVMEHLTGETLAQRLEKGPPPLEQALIVATEIADALSAAHRQGVIHRDLKPGNVMLTKAGAKLLDFGLAKLKGHGEQPAAAHLASAPTQSTPLTGAGMIVGTLQYMAPEQLEGKPADARTDLWALGAILYEMVTGKRAFEGTSAASLIGAILERDPAPVSTLQPLTPPALDRLVRQCLAKAPDDRPDTAHDVANDLRWIGQAGQTSMEPATTSARARYRQWIFGLSCLAAGVLVGVGIARLGRGPLAGSVPLPRAPVVRGVVDLLPDTPVALRVETEVGRHPTLLAASPDGTRVAFVGPARGGSTQLYLRDLNALEVRPVADTEGALHPFFSPDGHWLGFLTADKVKKVPINGGPSVTVCTARIPTRASWTRDGLIYVGEVEAGILSRVSENGGQLSEVTRLSGGLFNQILPDGRAALIGTSSGLARDYGRIALLSLETLKREPLPVSGYDARVAASGHLLFVRGGNLMVAPFDVGSAKVLGEPMLAVAGISTDSMFGWGQFAVSENGLLVYVPGADRGLGKLVAVDRAGGVQEFRAPERLYGALALSRDGTRLAVPVGDLNDYVWIFDLRRQEGRKLPVEGLASSCVWSPDDQRVAVNLTARRDPGIYTVPATGSGPAERVFDEARPDSWSPDGRWLAFSGGRGETRLGLVQMLGRRTVVPLPGFGQFSFSPDGRFLAYTSIETGVPEIWVLALADPSVARQVSVDGGMEPVWTRDHIFYRIGRRWFAARVTSLGPPVEWDPPQLVFETDFLDTPGVSYAVSPDGQRLFVVKSAHEPTGSKLLFVLNWFEELKAKVPTGR